MSERTTIEWTDSTWNPIRGVKGKWHCTHVSEGCRNCYAERINTRWGGPPYKPGADRFRLDEKILAQPLPWRRGRKIFVCDMTDLFHEEIPFGWIAAIFAMMAYCGHHTFQVLTKRPARLAEFMRWVNAPEGDLTFTEIVGKKAGQQITMKRRMGRVDPKTAMNLSEQTAIGIDLDACLYNGNVWPLTNVWLGVSVEDQKTAEERIPLLLQTPAAVRFVSYEPALEPVDFTDIRERDTNGKDKWSINALAKKPSIFYTDDYRSARGLDWIIVGGESGPHARPMHPSWARSVREQCQAAGVPFFLKQWGEWSHLPGRFKNQTLSRIAGYHCYIRPDGTVVDPLTDPAGVGGVSMYRVGKKAASRLLDGWEWSEFPSAVGG